MPSRSPTSPPPPTDVALGQHAQVRVTPYRVDWPAEAVTPKQSVILLLQVSWQRWQVLAQMLEDEVTGGSGPGDNGYVKPTYGMSPREGSYISGEQVSALAEAEAAERERCARLAKQAHDMGIEDEEWMT